MRDKNCCGCCSLATATSIIAILGLLGSFGGIIKASIGLIDTNSYSTNKNLNVTNGVSLGFSFLHVIFCILLLVAVKQRNPKLVIPWLVEMGLGLVVGIVCSIFLLIIGALAGLRAGGLLLLLAISFILACGLNVYFAWVVFSFYEQLKSENKSGPGGNAKRTDNVNVNNII